MLKPTGKPGITPESSHENKSVGETTIGDYLIQRLHHYGVEHCFGIPGDYVITLYEQMHQSKLILPVNTCDEQGSGFAADAYARLRGLGACCQTYGVGGLKSLHTTAEAFTERSPVVVISGAPGMNERSKGKLLHHLIDGYYTQLKLFEEVTTASTILEDPGAAFSEIDRVLSAALREKRPVYIEIPRDMFAVNGDPTHIPSDFRRSGSNQVALGEALGAIVQFINETEQPVIWAGVELQRYGLQDAFAILLEASGIPYASTILGKALLPELHPQFMGVYQGGLSVPDVREYVEASDCLLALGVLMTDINLGLHTAQINSQNLIHVTSSGMNVKGYNYEQVQLEDLVEGLATSAINWRRSRQFPHPPVPATSSSQDIYLQGVAGDVVHIPEGESTAGRFSSNPIVIDDSGVSRHHVSFKREGRQIWITDLNSSNGTFVNDNMLKPNVPWPLARGDEIGLGRLLTFELVGPVEKPVQPDADAPVDLEVTRVDPVFAPEETAVAIPAEPTADQPQFAARPGQKISSGRMFEAINSFLDDKTVVTADNGETLIAGVDLLIHCENGFFAPGFFTSVGFAIPIAMGAQLANPERRPLVLAGDAAFQMTGVELSTMVRFGLNPIIIVMNNGGYGSERPIHDGPYVDVLRWNYASFTDLLGVGKGIVVKTEDEMEAALIEARNHTESFVIIDVILEKFDYSPSFERFLSFFAKGVN